MLIYIKVSEKNLDKQKKFEVAKKFSIKSKFARSNHA